MAKNKYVLQVVMFLGIVITGAAQNRYMVFFADKTNNPYSISNPIDFLSQKAIDRKDRISISEMDLPVNPDYINGLQNEGLKILHTSKWLNGAIVEATSTQMESLDLSYVTSYDYIGFGSKPIPSGRIEGSGDNTGGRVEASFVQNEVLGVSKMNEDGYNGDGIEIAVLDAGFNAIDENIYMRHAFDNSRVISTYDFVRKSDFVYDYSSHGANVLTIFGASLDGSYIGGGHGADYHLFITEDVDSEYPIEEYNWLVAAEKADSAGVDIITTSLGYYTFDSPLNDHDYSLDDLDGQTSIITRALEMAYERGILVVTSAGNEGRSSNPWQRITFPADAEHALSVGAVNVNNMIIADFSSPGPTADNRIKPEVVAVGEGTTYINIGGAVTAGNGTSYAAPLIAGLAAGLWQKYPDLSNEELRNLILQSGDMFDTPNNNYGYGMPNYTRASNLHEGIETAVEETIYSNLKVYPNPLSGNEKLFINNDNIHGNAQLQLVSLTGSISYNVQYEYSKLKSGIEIPVLEFGTYILILRTSDKVYRQPIVIK